MFPVRGLHPGRRYRLLVWIDAAGYPTTLAIADYVDDVRQHEVIEHVEPFDDFGTALDAAVRTLDSWIAQGTLW